MKRIVSKEEFYFSNKFLREIGVDGLPKGIYERIVFTDSVVAWRNPAIAYQIFFGVEKQPEDKHIFSSLEAYYLTFPNTAKEFVIDVEGEGLELISEYRLKELEHDCVKNKDNVFWSVKGEVIKTNR